MRWDPDAGTIDAAGLEGVDAVVHLAGAGIGDKKWTPAAQATGPREPDPGHRAARAHARRARSQAERARLGVRDRVLRRPRRRRPHRRRRHPVDDFGAQVCVAWEDATKAAADAGIRVVRIRTGLVLAKQGGMLQRLLLPFKLGDRRSPRIGQAVHELDRARRRARRDPPRRSTPPSVSGPVNLTAPNPVTNAEFTESLGRALHRPTLLPTPMFGLKIVYGDELVETLLGSQRVSSAKLQASGFEFAHPELDGALDDDPQPIGVRLWIDTDVGDNPDDAVALLCAARASRRRPRRREHDRRADRVAGRARPPVRRRRRSWPASTPTSWWPASGRRSPTPCWPSARSPTSPR